MFINLSNTWWKPLLIVISVLTFSTFTYGQLTVNNSSTATQLANSFVGAGVEVFNVSSTCPTNGMGSFNGTSSNIGIDSGVILTSGSIFNAPGPNSSTSITTSNSAPGDNDLDSLIAPDSTFDACVLEFDITTDGDTVIFNYVFASDEYPEYVCSSFNDAFAFFISGPGISGTDNMALVPGTNTPVAINTVNPGTAGSFGTPSNCSAMDPNWASYNVYYVDNSGGATVEYDGFTTVLQAKHWVSPCDTYHLKLAIGDAGDYSYDSGVFLEGQSLTAKNIRLSAYTESNSPFPTAIEGCVNGFIRFALNDTVTDSLTLTYGIGGTATNGVDYATIADSITFLPGDSTALLKIVPFDDLVTDSGEVVKIYLLNQCTGKPYDSTSVVINEEFRVVAPSDTTICDADTIPIEAKEGGANFAWSPNYALSDDSIADPLAYPDTTTTYVVTSWTDSCIAFDTITITVTSITANASDVSPICLGDTVQLSASGGSIYSWQPTASLNNPNISNPLASPNVSTFYQVVVSSPTCEPDTDYVFVKVDTLPEAGLAFTDTLLCLNDSTHLLPNSNINYSYSWTPAQGLNCVNCPQPTAQPDSATTYTVLITDNNTSCENKDSLTVRFHAPFKPNAGANQRYCTEASTTIGPSSPNSQYSYLWQPSTGLNDTTIPNPKVTLDNSSNTSNTTYYILTATDTNQCSFSDTVMVTVDPLPLVDAGPDKTIKLNTGNSVTLEGESNASVLWNPAASLDDATFIQPNAQPDQTTTYTITATSAQGCVNRDTTIVYVTGIAIPNAFTPNGDGTNDEFTIYGASIQDYTVRVYNRWGGLVFESHDINNHWDGKNQNGEQQPIGTYVYMVKVTFQDGREVTKRGNITLLR